MMHCTISSSTNVPNWSRGDLSILVVFLQSYGVTFKLCRLSPRFPGVILPCSNLAGRHLVDLSHHHLSSSSVFLLSGTLEFPGTQTSSRFDSIAISCGQSGFAIHTTFDILPIYPELSQSTFCYIFLGHISVWKCDIGFKHHSRLKSNDEEALPKPSDCF